MPESTPFQGKMPAGQMAAQASASGQLPLKAAWQHGLGIINLRLDPSDAGLMQAAQTALGLMLPSQPGATALADTIRIIWAGPDDWFLLVPQERLPPTLQTLGSHLAGHHAAVTDVSSGYTVLRLEGPAALNTLAQGCPLDLHPRVFKRAQCAGTHYFKTSVWLWKSDDTPVFEMLVRRSFMGYVWQMIEKSTLECGLIA